MKRHAEGFSLVELMIAITLGLLLTAAVVSVFVGSRTAYQSTAGVGALSDGGRFALDLIGETARGAGNLACNSAMSATSATLLAGNTLGTTFTQGVSGYEANGTGNPTGALPTAPVVGAAGNWTPALDPAVTGAAPGPPGLPIQGSDVLVMRSSVARVAPVYTTADVLTGVTTAVPVTPSPVAMFAGQYAAISDCTKSVSFQIASVALGMPGTVNVSGGAVPLGFSAGAVVAPLTTTVYYIGVGSDGDGALWRLEQVNGPAFTAEELVPDVENMQVLYGIDTNGTETASAYVTADQVGAFNIVSLQVAVLAASPPGVPATPGINIYNLLGNTFTAPQDHRLRKVFLATINLRDAVH